MADEFSEIITSAGGSIKKREYWGSESCLRIKKNRKGHYGCSIWNWPDALREYERIMGLNEDVAVSEPNIEKIEDGPSVMMQAKTERSTRASATFLVPMSLITK